MEKRNPFQTQSVVRVLTFVMKELGQNSLVQVAHNTILMLVDVKIRPWLNVEFSMADNKIIRFTMLSLKMCQTHIL